MSRPYTHPIPGGRCGATAGVRPHARGPRCPRRTPVALIGRPEPDELLTAARERRPL